MKQTAQQSLTVRTATEEGKGVGNPRRGLPFGSYGRRVPGEKITLVITKNDQSVAVKSGIASDDDVIIPLASATLVCNQAPTPKEDSEGGRVTRRAGGVDLPANQTREKPPRGIGAGRDDPRPSQPPYCEDKRGNGFTSGNTEPFHGVSGLKKNQAGNALAIGIDGDGCGVQRDGIHLTGNSGAIVREKEPPTAEADFEPRISLTDATASETVDGYAGNIRGSNPDDQSPRQEVRAVVEEVRSTNDVVEISGQIDSALKHDETSSRESLFGKKMSRTTNKEDASGATIAASRKDGSRMTVTWPPDTKATSRPIDTDARDVGDCKHVEEGSEEAEEWSAQFRDKRLLQDNGKRQAFLWQILSPTNETNSVGGSKESAAAINRGGECRKSQKAAELNTSGLRSVVRKKSGTGASLGEFKASVGLSARGELFDDLFCRPSFLDEALTTEPGKRTPEQASGIPAPRTFD